MSVEFEEKQSKEFPVNETVIETRPANSRLESYASEYIQEKSKWNSPKINMIRLGAAYWGFFSSGLRDSTIGVIIPKLEEYYNISYFVVALVLLSPFFGYLLAAIVNNYIHSKVGRWGVSCIGASGQIAFYIMAVCKPPFPLLVVGNGISGFCQGLLDGSWNSMIGAMENHNQLLGILHGCYGIGGIVAPTIAQAMMSRGLTWNTVYFVTLSVASVSLCFSAISFRRDRAKQYFENMADKSGKAQSGTIKDALKNRLVILLSFTIFLYVGGEVSFGSWNTSYMIEVRGADKDIAGYFSTEYWTGLSLGRIILGFVSAKVGNLPLMVTIYLAGAIAMSLVYWLVPSMIASAVAGGIFGFLIGPLFPTMVAVATQKLPRHLHVSGIGAVAAFAGGGAGAMPFVGGVLANEYGPWSIAPLITAALSGMLVLWGVIWKFC